MLTLILLVIFATVLIILLNVSRKTNYMNYVNNKMEEHFYYPNCINGFGNVTRCYPYYYYDTHKYTISDLA